MSVVIIKDVERLYDDNLKRKVYILKHEDGSEEKLYDFELISKIKKGYRIVDIGITARDVLIDLVDTPQAYDLNYDLQVLRKEDLRELAKMRMLGVMPVTNYLGEVVDVETGTVILNNAYNVIGCDLYCPDVTAIFNGTNILISSELNMDDWFFSGSNRLYFGNIQISNLKAIDALGHKSKYGITLYAKNVVLNLPINKYSVPAILELFKRQYMILTLDDTRRYVEYDHIHTITFSAEGKHMEIDKEEIYKIVEAKVNRFKLPKKECKQLYNLLAMILWVNSIYISIGKNDNRYIELIKKLEVQVKDLYNNLDKIDTTNREDKRFVIMARSIHNQAYKDIKSKLY